MQSNYEINEGTLAIISTSKNNAKVLEDDKVYLVDKSSLDIVDHSCKYFGSSYEGRKDGAKEIIGPNYKLPIIIEDTQRLVFFPTTSPIEDDCVWIAVNKIKSYKEEDFNKTTILFINGQKIEVPLSYRAVQNQIFRATRLCFILQSHRKMDY